MDPSLPNGPSPTSAFKSKKKLIIIGGGAAALITLALILLVLSHTIFRGLPGQGRSNQGSGPNYSALTSCATSKTPLDNVPVDLTQVDQIIPLGQVNVPDHTLPTDHMYFSLNHPSGSSNDTVVTKLSSPGKIVVTQIQNSGETKNGTRLTNDYTIDFSACQEVRFRFGHIEKVSGKIADAVKNKDWDQPCEKHTPAAGEETFYCIKSTDILLNSGEEIGNVGGPGIGAFDLNAYDETVKNTFANQDRYPGDTASATCGINYFNSSTKTALLAKIKRTAEPRCGEIAQDKAGTAQGGWFATQDIKQGMTDWNSNLALIHHDIDPSIGVLAVGGKISNPLIIFFNPTHSGNINREPSEVKPSMTICYQTNATGNLLSSSNIDKTGSVILSLVDAKTMKVEHQDNACAASSTLTNPTIYYR